MRKPEYKGWESGGEHVGNWADLGNKELGLMNRLNDLILQMESRKPYSLPNLKLGDTIFVFSDYSGQHKESSFDVYSFLLVDINHCHIWFEERDKIRLKFLSDGRRLSFKNLNDKNRNKALYPFLYAANNIPSLIVSFAIDKKIESLFRKEGKLYTDDPELSKNKDWKSKTFENLLRIVHLNSLFVAGLSKENQDVYWISDDDNINANVEKLKELTNIFGNILSHYLSHDLRNIRCGSTGICDDGSKNIEDFCAIPDLVAGALSEMLSTYHRKGISLSSKLVVPPSESMSNKSKKIFNWLSDRSYSLKKLTYSISAIKDSTELEISLLKFIGSNS